MNAASILAAITCASDLSLYLRLIIDFLCSTPLIMALSASSGVTATQSPTAG